MDLEVSTTISQRWEKPSGLGDVGLRATEAQRLSGSSSPASNVRHDRPIAPAAMLPDLSPAGMIDLGCSFSSASAGIISTAEIGAALVGCDV